jgi:hypothetical protein
VPVFGLGKKRERPQWAGLDAMDLVPVRRIESELFDAEDRIRLLEPRFKKGLLGRFLQSRLPRNRAHVKVELDARGSDLWRAIDGRASVADLVRLFVERYPDDTEQAAERVWRFLAVMEHHGFIELEPDGEPRPKSP